MREFNPSIVSDHLRDAAETHILPLFRNLEDHHVSTKSSPNDLVTVADVAVEKALTPLLLDLWPGSQVIGEESAAEDPRVLDALGTEGAFWIVDPIDGTRNFVCGDERFASMAALVLDGVTQFAWIYFPVWEALAFAERGEGAVLKGAPLAGGADDASIGSMTGEYSPSYIPKPLRAHIKESIHRLGETRRSHCAAYNYLSLAKGDIDFAIQGKLKPWDHAPGALIVGEAGGRAAFADDGSDYAPLNWPDKLMIVSASAQTWPAIRKTLLPVE